MHRMLPAPRRCVVMGILNVTPNSFSDGGRYWDTSAAVEHGVRMFRAGADVVDVGGESTRPGSERVDAATETERVLPVVRGLADPDMVRVAAETGLPWVLMHWRGHSKDMNSLAVYDDVVAEVRSALLRQVDAAVAAGVAEDAIVLDPGLGFAKTAAHDWQLLNRLDVLIDTGLPVLVGASRKRFLGALLPDADSSPRPAAERDTATSVVSALSADRGAWGVRVHDVRGSLDAVAVTAEWNDGGSASG